MSGFYVSSKLKHAAMWLKTGLPIISSWVHGAELSDPLELGQMWVRYFRELRDCEDFLMYLEPGEVPKGALVELGAAIANGKTAAIMWSGTLDELVAVVGTIVHHPRVHVRYMR